MTVTPKKSSPQPASSSHNYTSPRSGPAQMDEFEGLRLKLSPDDAVSLAPSLAEPINLEDPHYARLRAEFESDAQNLEAESWSMSVDQNYLKALSKEAVKRQDVIYELIQTEMRHVRTLKILLHIYKHELRQSQLIEEARLDWLFLGVEPLLSLHQHFLSCLKARQIQSQEEGGPSGYQITQLGDILISQFSDTLGEGMMEYYSIFCSHNHEAISFYKEQRQNNKKLQNLIRRLGQLPLVRRLEIPECFLLVTQRITKYPVLVERIIQNTEADTDEYKSLVQGLARIKGTISQVNTQVSDYERAARLRDIVQRLEPRSQGRLKDGQLIRKEDLSQGNKMLLHEGAVTWKSSGRQKDIYAVLLSDMILLLQEKDQKLVFAAVDNRPPVISLQKLIVREVAHEDKAMFLICTCTTSLPEMYEIHTGSREERTVWTTLIREAMERNTQDEQTLELMASYEVLSELDDQIIQSLAKKQQIFAALYKSGTEQESSHQGLLLRGDPTDLQQGETLLKGAIKEVEKLQTVFSSVKGVPDLLMDENMMMEGGLHLRSSDADGAEGSESDEDSPVQMNHTMSDPQLQELYYSEGPEQSADDDTLPVSNCNSASSHFPVAEVYDMVIMLAQRLHSLQAIVAQQDSQIELQRASQSNSQQLASHYSSVLLEREKQRNLEKQKEQLVNKLQAQFQEEQQRWEKEREQQRLQLETVEAQLQQRERECREWEEKLTREKDELEQQRNDYQHDLERLRESLKSAEKEKERLNQESKRLEQLQNKLKSKYFQNLGHSNYDDPTQGQNLSSFPSFRGSIVNGVTLTPKPSFLLPSSEHTEIPPKVPPRKESISPQPTKPDVPIQLFSTTNQVHKPPVVQQQIPTKLAIQPKGKEKGFKSKGSHQRTHSAASIDVNQVLPIRATGKEGGSLRAKRNASPQRIYQSDTFKRPESGHSMKMSQSFSAHNRSSSDTPPPPPPPFPKDILETGKEKVIFL